MNWYKAINLIKLAAAKSKIQRYSIASPSVKFLIHRYEDAIPWDEAEKVKQNGGSVDSYIQEFVKTNLLPSLGEKINPQSPDNNFMLPESITDDAVAQEIRATEEAQGRVPRGNYTPAQIQGGRKIIADDINNEKAVQFNDWWKYMNEEEIYAQDPAFQYSILKPMIDSSPPNKKNSSPPLNAELLAGIWDEITNKGVDQMNILKKYRKLSHKAEKERAEAEGVQTTEKGGRWTRIKGGPSVDSPEELKENINRLKNLSQGTGWCTGRGMADTYLPQGDFYLYLENDKAVAAIRCVGNKVSEIRGKDNLQENLDPYWQEVINFLNTTSLDYQNCTQYKALQDIYLMNIDLEEGTPEYSTVLKQIQTDHKNYLRLSDENKQKFPEFRKTAAVGYRKELESALAEIERDANEGSYMWKFDRFQDKYENIPDEIKAELPDMQDRIIRVHKNAYARNPNLFTEFSEEIQQSFSPEEQADGWRTYVEADPYHYNDTRIPDNVRATIPIGGLVAQWKQLLANNIEHADNMPSYISERLGPNYVENIIINDFKKYPCNRDKHCFDKLKRVQEKGLLTEDQIAQVYSEAVERNPNIFSYMPPQYQDSVKSNMQDISPLAQKNLDEVIADASYFNAIPDPEIKNYLLNSHRDQLIKSFVNLKQRYGRDMNGYWKNIPMELRPHMPDYLKEEVANFFLPYVQKNQSFLSKVPTELHPFITNKLSSNINWYRKIRA